MFICGVGSRLPTYRFPMDIYYNNKAIQILCTVCSGLLLVCFPHLVLINLCPTSVSCKQYIKLQYITYITDTVSDVSVWGCISAYQDSLPDLQKGTVLLGSNFRLHNTSHYIPVLVYPISEIDGVLS